MVFRKSFFLTIFIALGLSFLVSSCETDVDLIAPYKSTPVIIGILDYTADSQYVRINRTFLGEGDATMYAGIRDSVEYNAAEVEAWLYKKRNGVVKDSIQLQYIVKPSRDPGVFYNQNVGFYYTSQDLFTAAEIVDVRAASSSSNPVIMTYQLRVTARGQIFTAETDFPDVSTSTITTPVLANPPSKLELYRPSFGQYASVTFAYKLKTKTARNLGIFRLNYDYVTSDGTTVTDQFIDYKLGANDNSEEFNNQNAYFIFNAQNWYEFIGQKIKAIPNVTKIRIHNTEFRLTGANGILNTYYKVANPVSEFTPVLNTFTNLDNGAIGIFGSRSTTVREAYILDPGIAIMNSGEFTSAPGLSYCVVDWASSLYVCNP